jgi:hypothetical protein
MTGYFGNGKGFGKVIEPYSTCENEYHIYNEKNILRWVITARCCQCGIICNNRCGQCNEVIFYIHKPNDIFKDGRDCSGYITKKFGQCLKQMLADANNFELTPPAEATGSERLMLLATVLMIDYRMFDDENNKEAIV